MFLFPREPHSYHSTKGVWQVDWIIFEGAGIGEFARNLLGLNQSEVCSIREPYHLSRKMQEIFEVSSANESMKNSISSGLVYSLLIELLRNAAFESDKATVGNVGKMDIVINYIHLHYAEELSLDGLANLVNLTPQYLCTLFRQYTSQTIFQYINMVRVSKSKELLLATVNMPVQEIAVQTGFHDVSYFCKVFRKLEGRSPLEFRRMR